MSWLSFTARKWFSAALTIAMRCDGRAWNESHTKFLSPISTLQPKPNPASCHFSCVQIEIDHAPLEVGAGLPHATGIMMPLQPHQGVVRSLTAFGRPLCLGDPSH